MGRPIMESSSIDLLMDEARKYPLLTKEEELDLGRLAQKGDREAIDKLVVHNLRFAVKVAGEFSNSTTPIDDLVGEAILGMYRAAELFDPDAGVKFTSYAVWWIRSVLQNYTVRGSRTIPLPHNAKQGSLYIKKYMMLPGADINATPAEIRKALGIPPSKINPSDNDFILGRHAVMDVLSLNEPLTDDDPNSWERMDLLASTDPTPEEIAEGVGLLDALLFALADLDDRARAMVEMRYLDSDCPTHDQMMSGVDKQCGTAYSLFEIGEKHGRTRERVRQIVNESFALIRRRHGKLLRQFLD